MKNRILLLASIALIASCGKKEPVEFPREADDNVTEIPTSVEDHFRIVNQSGLEVAIAVEKEKKSLGPGESCYFNEPTEKGRTVIAIATNNGQSWSLAYKAKVFMDPKMEETMTITKQETGRLITRIQRIPNQSGDGNFE